MKRTALLTLALTTCAVCFGLLASDPAAAKKRRPEPPRETPEYQDCPDGTQVEKGKFCPDPPPPPPPPPPPLVLPPPMVGEWQSNWGAVAVDSESAILGSVTGFTRIVRAEDAALADCRAKGGRACVFGYSYKDGCVVMVQGDRTYFFESAETASGAEKAGLDRCRSGQTGCRIRLSACALPTFIPY
jgi:hypothetical protein